MAVYFRGNAMAVVCVMRLSVAFSSGGGAVLVISTVFVIVAGNSTVGVMTTVTVATEEGVNAFKAQDVVELSRKVQALWLAVVCAKRSYAKSAVLDWKFKVAPFAASGPLLTELIVYVSGCPTPL